MAGPFSRDDAPSDAVFRIHRTVWGTVVRANGGVPLPLQMAQGVVLAMGAALAAGALALVVPGEEAAVDGLRTGLALVLGSMSLLLIRFATRRVVVELHFDLDRGELREVVHHRAGRPTLVSRHGFGGDGASLQVESRQGGGASLILRLRGGRGGLCIAQGPDTDICELRRRLDPELHGRPPRPSLAA